MLQIDRTATRSLYKPGEKITGRVKWDFRKRKKNTINLVLLWFTEGVGNTDVGIAWAQSYSNLAAEGAREFEFTAPSSPQSFHGQLFRLKWAIEMKSDHGEIDRIELDITPFETPISYETPSTSAS